MCTNKLTPRAYTCTCTNEHFNTKHAAYKWVISSCSFYS